MTDGPDALRIYYVTPEALLSMLAEGNIFEVTDGIPSGAEVWNRGYDQESNRFYLVVEHESFDDVVETDTIPEGDWIEITDRHDLAEEGQR